MPRKKIRKKEVLKIIISVISFIIFYLIIFLALALIFSTNWAIENYEINSFDQILYTLNSSVTSASNDIIIEFVKENIIVPLIITIIILIILTFLKLLFRKIEASINIRVLNKHIKLNFFKIISFVVSTIILVCSFYYVMNNLYIFDYIKHNYKISNFFEANYVNPRKVELEFPDEKRNLIYIFLESMESTYTNKDNGGAYDTNYIPELTALAHDYINFSSNESVGGAHMAYNASWTMAATIAHTSGIPLKSSFAQNSEESYANGLVNGAYSIGQILEEEGYRQYIMVGSDLTFGGRRTYYQSHGNYTVYDYYTAIEDGIIDEDYYVFWGYEDEKLFEYAKQELEKIAESDEPFNFTMLTVDTHMPDGYTSDFCPDYTDNVYLNAIYCSDSQLGEFVEWIQQQDFYENTTVILVGDHLSMNTYSFENIDASYERRIYNVFINSAVDTDCNKNREFNSFDFYPTTLAALGVSIKGERLGLGTNLFSCKKTLSEIYGNDYIDEELKNSSAYYDACITNECDE